MCFAMLGSCSKSIPVEEDIEIVNIPLKTSRVRDLKSKELYVMIGSRVLTPCPHAFVVECDRRVRPTKIVIVYGPVQHQQLTVSASPSPFFLKSFSIAA